MTKAGTSSAPEDMPKIWYSRILTAIEAHNRIDCAMVDNDLKAAIQYLEDYFSWKPDELNNVPSHLIFEQGVSKIKASTQDALKVNDGLLVISPKLRDVLVQFDLGTTWLHEVPVYFSDGKTLSKYPPHYLVHVTETKSALVPEESTGIELPTPSGGTEPLPTARWGEKPYETDVLAISTSAKDGVDLWADAKLKKRLFFSDRLKRAIVAAKIKSRGLKFVAAKALP